MGAQGCAGADRARPRDVEQSQAVVVRRDADGKEPVPLDGLPDRIVTLLDEIQRSLHDQAVERRDQMTNDASSPDEIDGPGFFRIGWDALGREEGEAKLAERAYTVPCLVTPEDGVPTPERNDDLIAYVAKAY